MTIEQQVLKKNTLLCEGSIRIGWVDASSMQAARIPPTIIESLRVKP
jgi:acyl-CoA thioester hydrolase